MKTEFRVATPENIDLTLSITMTFGEWKRLREQLSASYYPAWTLRGEIQKALAAARFHYRKASPESPGDPA